MEPRRITLGERTYELKSWSVADGDLWAFRLLRLVSSAASNAEHPADDVDGDDLSVGVILERVSPDDFVAFRDACFKHTMLIEHDADGVETVRDLVRAREAMRGRYTETMAIVIAHITHEFSPFLISAPALMGAGKKKDQRGSGSASPHTSTG